MKKDLYERYDPMVVRQTLLHLSDELHDGYPFREVFDYIVCHLPEHEIHDILEVGCGVGRMIGEMHLLYPRAKCIGIDWSYQMLKRASEVWVDGVDLLMDYSRYGFDSSFRIATRSLTDLHFGLAKCEKLPTDTESHDVVYSTFLLDRLEDPVKALQEMKRVTRLDGRIIIVSPLNYTLKAHWEELYPASKLKANIISLGLEIIDWQDELLVNAPLDRRGNLVQWKCVAMTLTQRP